MENSGKPFARSFEPEKQTMFSRQFLLSKVSYQQVLPKSFRARPFCGWTLTSCEKNDVRFFSNNHLKIAVIGTLVHPDYASLFGKTLLDAMFSHSQNLQSVKEALYRACGRYVVIIEYGDSVYLRSDALGLKQVYYSRELQFACSDIRLAETIAGASLRPNKDAADFYKSTFQKKGHGNAWIGSETIYSNLAKLLPNKYLRLPEFVEERFWPDRRLEKVGLEEAVNTCAPLIQSTLEALQHIAPLSIAVTAGNDSRVMLAASLHLPKDSYYFLDQHPEMTEGHPDLVIGKRLCNMAGKPHHVHKIQQELDPEGKEIRRQVFSSVFFAIESHAPVVAYYHKHLGAYINICGVGEFGRSVYGDGTGPISANYLCHKYQCTNSKYANKVADIWLGEVASMRNSMGINLFALFYMEQKLGNWGAAGNSESDIAFEEINPFSSHCIIEQFISLESSACRYVGNQLFPALVRYFDPSLDCLPINPIQSNKERLKKIIKSGPWSNQIAYLRYLVLGRTTGLRS